MNGGSWRSDQAIPRGLYERLDVAGPGRCSGRGRRSPGRDPGGGRPLLPAAGRPTGRAAGSADRVRSIRRRMVSPNITLSIDKILISRGGVDSRVLQVVRPYVPKKEINLSLEKAKQKKRWVKCGGHDSAAICFCFLLHKAISKMARRMAQSVCVCAREKI